MNSLYRATAVAILAGIVGCTSMQPLPTDCRGSACTKDLVAGDEILVTTTQQGKVQMKVTSIQPGRIVGQTSDKPPREISVATDTIAAMEKRQFSAGRTAGLVAGTGAATAVVVVVALGIGLGSALIALAI